MLPGDERERERTDDADRLRNEDDGFAAVAVGEMAGGQ